MTDSLKYRHGSQAFHVRLGLWLASTSRSIWELARTLFAFDMASGSQRYDVQSGQRLANSRRSIPVSARSFRTFDLANGSQFLDVRLELWLAATVCSTGFTARIFATFKMVNGSQQFHVRSHRRLASSSRSNDSSSLQSTDVRIAAWLLVIKHVLPFYNVAVSAQRNDPWCRSGQPL